MKRQHPIRKMRQAEVLCADEPAREKALARHVKPLLDALAEVLSEESVQDDHEFCDPACKVKSAARLLAAWKEPL